MNLISNIYARYKHIVMLISIFTDLVPLLVAGVAHGVVVVPPGALAGAGGLAVTVSAPPASLALPAVLGDRGHLGAETVGVVSSVTDVAQQIP